MSDARTGDPSYASVVLVDHPSLTHTDRVFTYSVPDDTEIVAGSVVRVPFHGKRTRGVVVELSSETDVPRVLPIHSVLGPALPPDVLALAMWTADRYLSTLGEALSGALPQRVASEEDSPLEATTTDIARDLAPFAAYRDGRALIDAIGRRRHAGFVWRPRSDGARGEGIAALVAAVVAQGRGAIVLVPEVRIRSEVVDALKRAFGDAIAWLGSDRAARARYGDWLALRSGAKRVAVGSRGAVFAPVQDLGLIVVDDEGHHSYKEGRAPRFHARTVAAERARVGNAPLVLVGVPPSVEARAATASGAYALLVPGRADERRDRPPVTVIERAPGERLTPSARTLTLARARLSEGARVLILTHRGGDHFAALCERAIRILKPSSAAILEAGRSATELRKALRSADLIISTPFIAKDLAIEGVGLVAIVEADAALAQPSFRAQEETFSTWWRAARWAAHGAIALETSDPSQAAIVALTRWDPEVLFRSESARRKETGYPPFASLARIDVPIDRGDDAARALREAAPELEILGPVQRDDHGVIVVRAKRREELLARLRPIAREWRERSEPMRIDVDPWEVLVPKWRS